MFGRFVTSLLCIALLGASPPPGFFAAPAGDRAAGPLGASPFNRIIPSGRIIVPAGVSVPVGMNSLGVAITPDGRYAIVTNDDEREDAAVNALDARVRGGYSLAVVETATMHVVDVFQAESKRAFFLGIAAVQDPADPHRTIVLASEGPANAVRVFDLSASGKLQPESVDFRMPVASDAHFANRNHAFPGSLIVSRDRTHAYVVNNLSNTVTALDLTNRRVLNTVSVGFFPYGIAKAGRRLLVTDEGLMNYAAWPNPAVAPAFSTAPYDAQKSSALSVLALDGAGDLATQHAEGLSLDRAPDGEKSVGGAHPSAVVTTPNAHFAFVAMTNLDRVATVSLTGLPRAISSIDLALFPGSPFGTQPNALALSAGLTQTARDQANDQQRTGGVGHTGSDGSTTVTRIQRYGTWHVTYDENIAYSPLVPGSDVIQNLLIDDGVPDRGHRRNIFDQSVKVVGIACAPHPRFGSVCVIVQAGGFTPK